MKRLMLVLVLALAACTTAPAAPTIDAPAIFTAAAETMLAQIVNAAPTAPPLQPTALPPPTAAASKQHQVGERVVDGPYAMTVTTVENASAYGFWEAGQGNRYLAVELVIESQGDAYINPIDFKVRDASGYEYSMAFGGKDPMLGLQESLPAGEVVRGWLTFEVPQTANGFILIFQPTGRGVRLVINLGQ